MGKISIKGHYQNLGCVFGLYSLVKAKGTEWTPVDDSLTAPNILLKYEEMKQLFDDYIKEVMEYAKQVNGRGLGMDSVNPLMTRVKDEVLACTADANFKADVVSRVKKIQGVRISPKIKMEVSDPNIPTEESIEQISAAQTDIESKLGHVGELIALLDLEPLYTTQIDELKVVKLKSWHQDLVEKNQKTVLQHGIMSTKRLARNKSFYAMDDGGGNLLASKIKLAFKSKYGGNSPQYHEASKFKYTTPKL